MEKECELAYLLYWIELFSSLRGFYRWKVWTKLWARRRILRCVVLDDGIVLLSTSPVLVVIPSVIVIDLHLQKSVRKVCGLNSFQRQHEWIDWFTLRWRCRESSNIDREATILSPCESVMSWVSLEYRRGSLSAVSLEEWHDQRSKQTGD